MFALRARTSRLLLGCEGLRALPPACRFLEGRLRHGRTRRLVSSPDSQRDRALRGSDVQSYLDRRGACRSRGASPRNRTGFRRPTAGYASTRPKRFTRSASSRIWLTTGLPACTAGPAGAPS